MGEGLSPLFRRKDSFFRRPLKNNMYRRFAAAPPFPKTLIFRYKRLDGISGGDALGQF